MEDDYEIRPEKRIRVSTYSSDFEGKVAKITDEYLCLSDAEEVYDHLYHGAESCGSGRMELTIGREQERRKTGKIKIPLDKINHYEFLES